MGWMNKELHRSTRLSKFATRDNFHSNIQSCVCQHSWVNSKLDRLVLVILDWGFWSWFKIIKFLVVAWQYYNISRHSACMTNEIDVTYGETRMTKSVQMYRHNGIQWSFVCQGNCAWNEKCVSPLQGIANLDLCTIGVAAYSMDSGWNRWTGENRFI